MKTFFRRIAAAALAACSLLAPLAQAEYVGSEPAACVYLEQPRRHTCTLTAATMMLRNYAEQTDGDGEAVTLGAVQAAAWNSRGLKWDFTVGGVNVLCSHDVKDEADKKAYLIDMLARHPEGFVIYDADMPHAVWLFGYDDARDVFYCADTTTDAAGGAIPLADSILRGETQQDKIDRIDRVWYVATDAA